MNNFEISEMKRAIILLSVILLISCSTNHYLLNDKNKDKKYLVKYISELEKKGEMGKTPLLVVDGIPADLNDAANNPLQFSRSDVKEIDYLKKNSEVAMTVYGEQATDGVILLTTYKVSEKSAKTIDDSKILFLIGDKPVPQADLENIDPNDIESIEVIKNKDAIKKITPEDYDGVIIITMKKEHR